MGNSPTRVAPLAEQSIINVSANVYPRSRNRSNVHDQTALPQRTFHAMLTLERRRVERSRTAFALMLLSPNPETGASAEVMKQAVEIVLATKRETDLVGWYSENSILGTIFTEVNLTGSRPIAETLRIRFETGLIKALGPGKAAKIAVSLHVFGDNWDKNPSGWVADSRLYPDLDREVSRKRPPEVNSVRLAGD